MDATCWSRMTAAQEPCWLDSSEHWKGDGALWSGLGSNGKTVAFRHGKREKRLGLLKAGTAPGGRAVEKSDERFRSKESAGY